MIDIDILLPRLGSKFSIVGSVALWIRSYLTDRMLRRRWRIDVSCVEVSWRRLTYETGSQWWHRDCRRRLHHFGFHTLEEWSGHGCCKRMQLPHSRPPPHPSITDPRASLERFRMLWWRLGWITATRSCREHHDMTSTSWNCSAFRTVWLELCSALYGRHPVNLCSLQEMHWFLV